MENYVVAYLLDNNNYEVKFVVAEDAIKACSKVIPQFELLVTQVKEYYGYLDADIILENKSKINLIDFSCIAIPALNVENNIKTQIITIFDTNKSELIVLQRHDKTKRDALLNTIYDFTKDDGYVNYLSQVNDIRQIIFAFAHASGLRVYTVDTLRSLVKNSLE